MSLADGVFPAGSLIYGCIVVFAVVYFLIYGRKVYEGPVVLVKQNM